MRKKKNKKITKYLTKARNEYFTDFNSISNKDKLLTELFTDLQNFNFKNYHLKLKLEIKENLKEWWTNPKVGILKEEELFGILFEFDNYFFMKDVEATAYGIGEWKNFKVKTKVFDMGYDYDFTTEFYASPGITLSFFDSLEKLDDNKLSNEYKNKDIYEFEGYFELMELYKFEGFLAIHKVLIELDEEGVFEVLNYKKDFMFMIEEHDDGDVHPLLIK